MNEMIVVDTAKINYEMEVRKQGQKSQRSNVKVCVVPVSSSDYVNWLCS